MTDGHAPPPTRPAPPHFADLESRMLEQFQIMDALFHILTHNYPAHPVCRTLSLQAQRQCRRTLAALVQIRKRRASSS